MRLRPYQSALVGQLGAAFGRHRAVLLQLPTAGGKTHIAAHVTGTAAAVGERVWIIAHRREIVGQTSAAIGALGVAHGVIAPGFAFEPERLVQVCSVASLGRRANGLPPPDQMIWDEAHHIASASWSALRARYPNARHLGLTATPARLDGKGLDAHFDVLLTGPSTAELMQAGHLSRYRLFAPTIPDLRGVGTRAGDYARDQLAERMSGTTLVGDVVEHYQRLAAACRAVAFAVSVEASRVVIARFQAAGVPAAHIDGGTPYAVRDAAIADLEAGRIRVLSNVEVFTEGFDLPAIDAVILLRPTRSLALYRQMVGRGLRAAPGKAPTIILDHAGLVYDHDLPDEAVEWTLAGVRKRPGAQGIGRLRRCPDCSAVHSMAGACPECGHEYAAGDRSIEEVYGELRERGQRAGYETLNAFAIRIGLDRGSCKKFPEQGMPYTADGLVPIEEALAWYNARGSRSRLKPPLGSTKGEFETQIEFARRVELTPSGIAKMVKRGLPVAVNGWVHIERGLAWVAVHRHAKPKPALRLPFGLSVGEFAERLGVRRDVVVAAKKRGMPVASDGSILADAAIKWWRQNRSPPRGTPPAGYESPKAFCRRIGISETGGRRGLLRRGLPIELNGLVHIETGLRWIAEHGATTRSEGR